MREICSEAREAIKKKDPNATFEIQTRKRKSPEVDKEKSAQNSAKSSEFSNNFSDKSTNINESSNECSSGLNAPQTSSFEINISDSNAFNCSDSIATSSTAKKPRSSIVISKLSDLKTFESDEYNHISTHSNTLANCAFNNRVFDYDNQTKSGLNGSFINTIANANYALDNDYGDDLIRSSQVSEPGAPF